MNPELYEKHYEFEWNHRTYLSSAQNVPIGVMSLLGGAVTILIQKFPYATNWETKIFLLLISFSIFFLIIAIYFLFRAIIGYEYKRIATPLKLKAHYDDLLDWWEKHGDGGVKEASKDFHEFVYQRLAEATEVNAKNNQDKSKYLYSTNKFLAVSFLVLAFASIPYLIKTVNKEAIVHKIEIVETKKHKMEVMQMSDNENENTQQAPQPDPDPPKPEGPPNENIREDVLIPESPTGKPKK